MISLSLRASLHALPGGKPLAGFGIVPEKVEVVAGTKLDLADRSVGGQGLGNRIDPLAGVAVEGFPVDGTGLGEFLLEDRSRFGLVVGAVDGPGLGRNISGALEIGFRGGGGEGVVSALA